jgi:hypothetical protein
MTVQRFCEACGMVYDWPGVTEGGIEFCCEACARGEPCTCPRHPHVEEKEHSFLPEEVEHLGMTPESAPLRRTVPPHPTGESAAGHVP